MNIKKSFMISSGFVLMGWSWLAFAQVAGHVMFVSGQVQVQDDKGQLLPVSTGQAIDVGQRLITQEGGYVHLKMVDEAFYSLRPNSRFLIEDYRYDADQPSNNRVKTQLESGIVRAITGKAGETNKQGYRLNTPVAAIGVRGTDYIVHHTSESTRVAVSSGAVVVSTFNGQCSAAGLGACAGEAAMLLAANLTGDYIEVRADQRLPERKQEQWTPQAGKSPATLTEPIAANSDDSRSAQTAANTAVNVQAQKPLEPSAFTWGRWQDEATQSTFRDPAQTIRGLNVGYWLAQANDTIGKGYPNTNKVDFSLAHSEAALRHHDGSWQDAKVDQGNLTVNMAQGSFATNLSGHLETNQPWALSASGAVQANGLLASNPIKSDPATWVEGAANASASQAAFSFDKRLAEGALVGIAHWRAPQ